MALSYKVLVFALFISVPSIGKANTDIFEGDQRLACEALLCLTVGWGESECRPAINKFFSIWSWKPSRLFSKRMGFLELCPSEINTHKQSLIVNYSGRCQGQRFTNYVSAYRSYTEVETENGGSVRTACHWNDKSGVWMHSQAERACESPLIYANRLSLANQDCAAFREVFEIN